MHALPELCSVPVSAPSNLFPVGYGGGTAPRFGLGLPAACPGTTGFRAGHELRRATYGRRGADWSSQRREVVPHEPHDWLHCAWAVANLRFVRVLQEPSTAAGLPPRRWQLCPRRRIQREGSASVCGVKVVPSWCSMMSLASSTRRASRRRLLWISAALPTALLPHCPRRDRARYERKLITEAESALRQADVLLLVQDIAKRFTQSDRDLIRRVADTAASRKAHFFLALNKADLLTGAHNWRGLSGRAERDRRAKCRELLMAKQDAVADAFEAAAMEAGLLPPDGLARADPPPLHCTSAWHGDGVLRLRSALASVAVPGEWRYPSGIHSDRTNLARVTEAIREALFRNLHQEVPYQAQQVNRGWRVTRKRELVIHQDILVPRRAHVNMLLGRRAATLSAISRAACRALEGIFQRRVHLYLHVAMTKRADGSGVGLEEGVEGVAMAQRGAVDAVGLHRQPLVQDAARQRVQDAVAGLGGLLGEAVPRSPPVADLSAARSAHEAQFLAPDAVWRPPAE